MPRNIGLCMTGKTHISTISLKGNNPYYSCEKMPIEIINIKIMILNLVVIPFMSKNWKKLEENICFLDIMIQKINFYLSIYNDNEYLLIYKDLLYAFETAVVQHLEIQNLEKYFKDENTNTISTMVFKTTMIRLKTEYELYNLIIGKPNLSAGETYNMNIINIILKQLEVENINFENIKLYINTHVL